MLSSTSAVLMSQSQIWVQSNYKYIVDTTWQKRISLQLDLLETVWKLTCVIRWNTKNFWISINQNDGYGSCIIIIVYYLKNIANKGIYGAGLNISTVRVIYMGITAQSWYLICTNLQNLNQIFCSTKCSIFTEHLVSVQEKGFNSSHRSCPG